MFSRVFTPFVLAFAMAMPATAAANPSDQKLSNLQMQASATDRVLATKVVDQVRGYAYTIFDDVSAEVREGIVTLSGKVTAPYKAAGIVERVKRIPGVREVADNLDVMPTSIYDNELRATIADRIYSNPAFWNYAIQSDPSIHVIVEGGHVTLTGVVNSEADRLEAESIARGTFGVLGFQNKLMLERDLRSES